MPGNFHAVPESVVESWPKPNFVDPVRREWLPAFALTWQVASTLLVAGRFYLRARKQAGSFGLDDLMIFIGWIFSIGLTTVAWLGAERYDLDRHTWDVHTDLYVGAALTGWIAQVMFIFSTVPTKLSVLLFYRRMAKDSLDRRWLYAIYLALFVTAAYGLAVFLTYCLICQPLSAYWLSYDFSYDKPFKCIDGNVLTLTSGILSVFSDCYAVALPCLMLRHYDLDVPKKQKMVLNFIFALGFLVTGAGIARTYYLWRINHTFDTSWTGFDLYVWSLVELHLAIVCACAPSLRAFFRHYLLDHVKRSFSSVSYYAGGSRKGNERRVTGDRWLGPMRRDLEHGKGSVYATERSDSMQELTPVVLAGDKGRSRAAVAADEEYVVGPLKSETIRTAEEYEAYALRPLSRHKAMRSSTAIDGAYGTAVLQEQFPAFEATLGDAELHGRRVDERYGEM